MAQTQGLLCPRVARSSGCSAAGRCGASVTAGAAANRQACGQHPVHECRAWPRVGTGHRSAAQVELDLPQGHGEPRRPGGAGATSIAGAGAPSSRASQVTRCVRQAARGASTSATSRSAAGGPAQTRRLPCTRKHAIHHQGMHMHLRLCAPPNRWSLPPLDSARDRREPRRRATAGTQRAPLARERHEPSSPHAPQRKRAKPPASAEASAWLAGAQRAKAASSTNRGSPSTSRMLAA